MDAARFEHLVERARREAERGIADGSARRALELWRGAPLADVASEPFAGAEIRRLEELHLRAIELAIDAELAAGTPRRGDRPPRGAARRASRSTSASTPSACSRFTAPGASPRPWRATAPPTAPSSRSGSSPGPSCAASRSRSSPTTPPSTPARRRASSRASSRAARRCSPAETASCGGCESAGPRPGRVGPGSRSSPARRGSARPGSPPSSPPTFRPEADGALRRGLGRPRRRARGDPRRASRASSRPCSCSTTPTTPRPPCSRPRPRSRPKPRDTPLLLLVLHRDDEGPPAFAAAAQRLALRPLRVEAAAEIAELYAPADGVAMPLETLMAESEGVPLRVHRAASGWAQAQAAERLEATAGKAAIERGGLRAARGRGGGKRRRPPGRPRADQPLRGRRAAGSPRSPRCARSAAWRRLTPPTPSTSSAASGSSPTSWRAWSAPP